MDISLIENHIDISHLDQYAAIIGQYPSKGARSPKLWNAVFESEKRNCKMLPLDVKKENNFDGSLTKFDVDLSGFKSAISSIGDYCRDDALLLVESTVPPGTCEKIVQPIIKDCLQKRGLLNGDIKIAHSYERVMPGPGYIDSIQNFYRVYSGIDNKSAKAAESFLHTIIHTDKYPLTRLKSTNATEMAKVLENSYRAMNIAFMVEWSRYSEETDVDIYEVINAIRLRPTHSNLMYPGIGVGGYCLTKDALLASWSRQHLFDVKEPLTQSENAININDQMPRMAYEFLKRNIPTLQDLRILLLGISYRGDVGDTRSSPVENFYNYLMKDKALIQCHDPYIEYWQEKSIQVEKDLLKLLNDPPDIIIFSAGHSLYKKDKTLKIIYNLPKVFLYDTIGLLSNKQINYLKKNHTVKVLGRGDI